MPDGEAEIGFEEERTDAMIGAQGEIATRAETHGFSQGGQRFPRFSGAGAESGGIGIVHAMAGQRSVGLEEDAGLQTWQSSAPVHDILPSEDLIGPEHRAERELAQVRNATEGEVFQRAGSWAGCDWCGKMDRCGLRRGDRRQARRSRVWLME